MLQFILMDAEICQVLTCCFPLTVYKLRPLCELMGALSRLLLVSVILYVESSLSAKTVITMSLRYSLSSVIPLHSTRFFIWSLDSFQTWSMRPWNAGADTVLWMIRGATFRWRVGWTFQGKVNVSQNETNDIGSAKMWLGQELERSREPCAKVRVNTHDINP